MASSTFKKSLDSLLPYYGSVHIQEAIPKYEALLDSLLRAPPVGSKHALSNPELDIESIQTKLRAMKTVLLERKMGLLEERITFGLPVPIPVPVVRLEKPDTPMTRH